MGRIATSVDEQIKLLRKRGMVIENPSKAKEVLLDIGYYRLGFYWNCFEIDDKHNFREGTNFNDVVCLYYLDVDLRELLLKYIYRIEVHFRTQIVYFVSNKYKDSPTWFIDPKIVSSEYAASFNKLYDDNFKKNNRPLFKHHKKYLNDKYAPAWKTVEFFTFGASLKLFASIKDENVKQIICNSYGIKRLYILQNFISSVVFVRNMCAHGNVLYDLKQPKGIKPIPDKNYQFSDAHSLDASVKAIGFLLSKISRNREKDLQHKLADKLKEVKDNPIIEHIVKTKMGFSLL